MNIEERLDRPERQNRNLRRGLVGLGLATFVLLVCCMDSDDMGITKSGIQEVNEAVERYHSANHRIPTLEELITTDEKGRTFLEGFSSVPTDAWGTPYAIREKGPGRWEVFSWGPDTLRDTGDDICLAGSAKKN